MNIYPLTVDKFQVLGHGLAYDTLDEVRRRIGDVSPNLVRYGDVEEANYFKQAQQLSSVSIYIGLNKFEVSNV